MKFYTDNDTLHQRELFIHFADNIGHADSMSIYIRYLWSRYASAYHNWWLSLQWHRGAMTSHIPATRLLIQQFVWANSE